MQHDLQLLVAHIILRNGTSLIKAYLDDQQLNGNKNECS